MVERMEVPVSPIPFPALVTTELILVIGWMVGTVVQFRANYARERPLWRTCLVLFTVGYILVAAAVLLTFAPVGLGANQRLALSLSLIAAASLALIAGIYIFCVRIFVSGGVVLPRLFVPRWLMQKAAAERAPSDEDGQPANPGS
jgi:hypothetical protein